MNEVIEAMAAQMENRLTCENPPMGYREVAEELLNLCYKCEACGGSGKSDYISTDSYGTSYLGTYEGKCPICKGTGKGERMLAVLDKNQGLIGTPRACKNTSSELDRTIQWMDGYKEGQHILIQNGWKKVRTE